MMATEEVLPISVTSMVEDVLQEHGHHLNDIDLASRKAEEASLRRYEAAEWLRRMVGVVGGKDLPAQPSEEEFRIALRSGILLCNVLNKVKPGAVPKVVEGPSDSVIIPDGAALSVYQYFENVRNFLVAVEEMGLPTFEASDLEQGGKSSRIVICVLALKSYSAGSRKFGGNSKPSATRKHFIRKNAEPFMNFLARSSSAGEKSLDSMSSDNLSLDESFGYLFHDINEASNSGSLYKIVHDLLSDKKREEIPFVVEYLLTRVMEEFERRLAVVKTTSEDPKILDSDKLLPLATPGGPKVEEETVIQTEEDDPATQIREADSSAQTVNDEAATPNVNDESKDHKHDNNKKLIYRSTRNHITMVDRHIEELKHTLQDTKSGMQLLQKKYHEELTTLDKHFRGLVHAAAAYHKVLAENRKLYNQVQDLKGNIRVYCRVRPFLGGHPSTLSSVDQIAEGNITIVTPTKYSKDGRKSFSFNKVFGPSITQEEVFSDTQPLIRSVLDGYNVCIFAYGQTGSGKTYTMSGPDQLTPETLGVNYRALNDLFLLSEQRKDTISYTISVQMLEIYNDQIRDLLLTDGSNRRLEVRNSSHNGINVPDACLVPVSSPADVIDLMNLGQGNRAVCATAMNDRSSRSHSCLTVHIQGRELTSGSVIRGSLHLVDLAGSERVEKSEVTGDRLKEATHINKSLSALGDVISSLAQKSSHIPYRNSKLTQLLQDALGGQAKTLMFVHISPEPDAVGETISTLKFAERVSSVELGAARVNKDSGDVKELKEQIASLKAALAKKEGEKEPSHYSRPSTPERHGVKSSGSSPSHPRWKSNGDSSVGRRQHIEDAGNVEVQNSSALNLRRQDSDQEMPRSSLLWPSTIKMSPGTKEDDKESASSENLIGDVDVDIRQSTETCSQSPLADPSKIYPEHLLGRLAANKEGLDFDEQRSQYDSDELEAATSETSESDMLWQLNVPKAAKVPDSLGSKPKKTQRKQPRSPGSMNASLIPQPSRKGHTGVTQPLSRVGRQFFPASGKRVSGNLK